MGTYLYSDAAVDGPLGYNWHHSYNLGIRQLEEGAFAFRHADGRESFLPALKLGESHFDRREQLAWTLDDRGYMLTDIRGLQYRFDGPENRSGYRMVSGISTKDGFRIRFEYASGEGWQESYPHGRIPEGGNRRVGTGTLRIRTSGR
mgnify:FL=1